MREIKFRGFDNKSKTWFYGSLDIMYDNSTFISYWISELIEPENNYYEMVQKSIEVDPKSIGQFIKVINNIDVYEGDVIIGDVYERECYDEFESQKPIVLKYEEGVVFPFNLDYQWRSGIEEIKILGNIYENPELVSTSNSN